MTKIGKRTRLGLVRLRRLSHLHHGLRHLVCFPLETISCLVHHQFGLGPRRRVEGHSAEIMTKARFHEGTGRDIQRLAGRAQDFMDNRRRQGVILSLEFGVPGLPLQALLPAFLALPRRTGVATTLAFALQQLACRNEAGNRR
jgi:hypothetical protein